jgi:hypothetical protein
MRISIVKNKNYFYLIKPIRNIFIYFTIISGFCTYLFSKIFNFGEIVAEGIPVISGLIYFFTIIKKNIFTRRTLFLTTYFIIILVYTQIAIINSDHQEYYRYFFIYSLLPAYLLYCCSEKILFDQQLIFNMTTIIALISALVGISQFLHLQSYIPLFDSYRAQGLSKSTLNYSTLLFIGYVATSYSDLKVKKIIQIIILLGVICSLSRSAIVAILIYELIDNIKFFFLIVILTILLSAILYLLRGESALIDVILSKYSLAASFTKDIGNVARLVGYKQGIYSIDIIGHGLGSTGPAVDRFSNNWVAFESFLINSIYTGGFAFFIFVPFIFFFALDGLKPMTKKKIALILSYLFMIIAHQTFETPSVNIMAWLVLIASLHIDKKFAQK